MVATVTTTTAWKKGVSGDFATASNWTNGVPTGSTDATIGVSGTYTVTSSISESMRGLTISDKGATLSITDGTFAIGPDGGGNAGTISVGAVAMDPTFEIGSDGVTTTFNNTGKINLTGPSTTFEIEGTVNLTGTGTVNLSNVNVADDGTTSELINHNNILTTGTETIGDSNLTLDNYGHIYAEAGTLTLNTGGNTIFNESTGVLAADGGGGSTLDIDSNVDQLSGSSEIRANGNSTVYINDVTVTGGQIDARVAGGEVFLNGATINNASLDSGGTTGVIETTGSMASILNGGINTANLVVTDNTALTLEGSINNTPYWSNSAINVDSTGDETDLWVSGSTTLSGGGNIVLSDNSSNVIDGPGDGTTSGSLTSNNTISGAGSIGLDDGSLSLTNTGTINAAGTNALVIDTGDFGTPGSVTNTGGTLKASGTGGLGITDTGISGGTADIYSGSNINMLLGSLSNVSLNFENNSGYSGDLVVGLGSSLNSGTLGSGTTIAGFAGTSTSNSDEIDLQTLKFSSTNSTATWTQGTGGNSGEGILAVANGHQTVDITLMGSYSSGDFNVAKDSSSGTLVTTTNSSNALV